MASPEFTYNSLSQLLTSKNPESGTITYTYDADGNVLTKLDARSITTTFVYDVLHRLTKKTYSDTTPQVTYWYDGQTVTGCTPPALTVTNGIGRRTAMCDAAGSEVWSYDQMGRVLIEKRITNGLTKTTSYTYNLDGSLATITYPSGRVITYTPSAADRTLSAVDTTNSINYATGALYSPVAQSPPSTTIPISSPPLLQPSPPTLPHFRDDFRHRPNPMQRYCTSWESDGYYIRLQSRCVEQQQCRSDYQ